MRPYIITTANIIEISLKFARSVRIKSSQRIVNENIIFKLEILKFHLFFFKFA